MLTRLAGERRVEGWCNGGDKRHPLHVHSMQERSYSFFAVGCCVAMSVGAAAAASTPHSSDCSAAEAAVRALWSSLNRLDHSLTYLLPENCDDAIAGEFAMRFAARMF